MPSSTWNIPATSDVLNRFTPAEQAQLQAIQGSSSVLAALLADVVLQIRGAVQAGGYDVDQTSASSIPPELRNDCCALVVWRWVASLPVAQLATKPREEAFTLAEKKLAAIGNQKMKVTPPVADTSPAAGQWNSEPKLIMRTHPVPQPAVQFPPDPNDYANPTGPPDQGDTD